MMRRPRNSAKLMAAAFAYAALVFLITPTLLIAPMSITERPFLEFPPTGFTLKWYAEYFNDADWLAATRLSALIALGVSFLATSLGLMVSLAIVRGRMSGAGVVQILTLSPIVVPNIVIGVAMYFFFAELGMIGSGLAFVLAHTVLALPYAVLTISAALERYDPDFDLAALGLGASRTMLLRKVTLPLIAPGVASAAIFAFITSFDEPVIAYFLSGPTDKTLPRKLFENVGYTITPVIAAVGTLLTLFSVLLLSVWLCLRHVADRRFGTRHRQET